MNNTPLGLPIVFVTVAILAIVFSIRRLRTLRRLPYGKWRRNTERVVLALVILVCAAAAVSTTYHAAALRYYRSVYRAPGRIYNVNGYGMHLYCTGSGSPTILLDAGLGNDSLDWDHVQPALSKTTRVCSYDRAGSGWSEPQPGTRDADQITSQLHALLQQAGVTGPLVLMGHSMGGIYIRDYASRYPQEIVGLIFVEAGTPLLEARESVELRAASNISMFQYYFYQADSTLGIERLTGGCSYAPGAGDEYFERVRAEDECGKLLEPLMREYQNIKQSGDETVHTGPYGDLPVLIFSRDLQIPQGPGLPPKLETEIKAVWDQAQEELKALSSHSRRIIAKGSGHHIPRDRADLINREVPLFIEQIRSGSPPPAPYGSTETE